MTGARWSPVASVRNGASLQHGASFVLDLWARRAMAGRCGHRRGASDKTDAPGGQLVGEMTPCGMSG